MRTPNAACVICAIPLYRRPNELAQIRFAACMTHRAVAQSVVGVTDRQKAGLSLGREPGTNHRTGYKHRDESKRKIGVSGRAFWVANPEAAAVRGLNTRADGHYNWKGGVSNFNLSIRLMHENRVWMDAVKKRDGGQCVTCGGTQDLESHHIEGLSSILARHEIASRDEARACPALWDISNGKTLCRSCHYAEHGRTPRAD